jgi:hypothetical protein
MRLGVNTANNYSYIQSAHRESAWADLILQPLAGNVGIGTDNPLQALAVQGNAYLGDLTNTLNFTGGGGARFLEIGATGDALLVTHASGSGVGYFGYSTSGDRLVVACDNGGGNNKIDFIVNAGGTTGVDNLNGVAAAVRITSGGVINSYNGIAFPNQSAGSGTVASSTLDAYEEGTSTIYFRATGQSSTPTATAYYTRIGNIVYYCFEGTINATANSNAYFDGLPFLPASGYPRSAFYVGWNSATHNSNGGNVYTSGTYAGTGFFWQRNAFALASYWYTGTQYLTVSGSYQV